MIDPPLHAGVQFGKSELAGDPFDRMLVAQALAERLTLVTHDTRIKAYATPTLSAR